MGKPAEPAADVIPNAWVLPHGFAGGDPVVFPGVPGRWTPGVPVEASAAAAAAGVSEQELDQVIVASGVPLERVTVTVGAGPAERPDGHLSAGDTFAIPEASADAVEDADHTTVEE